MSPQFAALRPAAKQSCKAGTVLRVKTPGYPVERRSDPSAGHRRDGTHYSRKGAAVFLTAIFVPARRETPGFLFLQPQHKEDGLKPRKIASSTATEVAWYPRAKARNSMTTGHRFGTIPTGVGKREVIQDEVISRSIGIQVNDLNLGSTTRPRVPRRRKPRPLAILSNRREVRSDFHIINQDT